MQYAPTIVLLVIPIIVLTGLIVYQLFFAQKPDPNAWRYRPVRNLVSALLIAWVLSQIALKIFNHHS
jgi:hypothetical protein